MTNKELKEFLLEFINRNNNRFVDLCKEEGVDGDEVLEGLMEADHD